MLRESLQPLLQLSKKLDEKLPVYSACLQGNDFKHTQSSRNCDEILKLKKEVDDMKADCEQTLLKMTERNDIFDQLRTSMDQSYEYLEACVSLMEGKLELKGYEPFEIEAKKRSEKKKAAQHSLTSKCCDVGDSNKPSAIIGPLCQKSVVNDETFCVIRAHPSSSAFQSLKTTDVKNDEIESPISNLPVSIPDRFTIDSPKLPDFFHEEPKSEISSQRQQNFFGAVLSPTVPELSIDLKVTDKKLNSLFPPLQSPVTPNLTTGPTKKKDAAKFFPKSADLFKIQENDSDEDNIVMHSRRSFMMNNHVVQSDPNTPDVTVNLLKTKKFEKKFESPETPELEVKTESSLYAVNPCQNKDGYHSFDAPDTPELSQINPPAAKRSPTITAEQYRSLSTHIQRLVSYEQANLALKNCYHLAKQKSSSSLTADEVDAAIDLGGRTKCCLLMLKSLNLIKKIAGSNEYEICD